MTSFEQDVLNAAQNTGQQGGTAPILIDLGNGQQIPFNSVEELNTNLKQAFGQVSQHIAELRAKAETNQAPPPAQNVGQTVSDDSHHNKSQFEMNEFIRLMGEDPRRAFDYVDRSRYGMEDPVSSIKQELEELRATRQEVEVAKWLQKHPEFPGGQAAEVLDRVRQQINQPMTSIGLEAAYGVAIANQLLPDFRTQAAMNLYNQRMQQQMAAQQQQQYVNQQNNAAWQQPQQYNGIPTIPRQALANPQVEQALENMSMEQLEGLLKKYGAL